MNEVTYNTDTKVTQTISNRRISEYEPYILVDERDVILHSRIEDFNFNNSTVSPEEIASRLIETAKLHNVFGIAANQVGLRYKVFVAGANDSFVAFFNPKILFESPDTSIIPEIDLSNMGLILNVKRSKSISLEYQDYQGNIKTVKADGLTARIIQQNVDRLNGFDFKDNVTLLVLKRALKARDKKVKKFVRQNSYIKRSK